MYEMISSVHTNQYAYVRLLILMNTPVIHAAIHVAIKASPGTRHVQELYPISPYDCSTASTLIALVSNA